MIQPVLTITGIPALFRKLGAVAAVNILNAPMVRSLLRLQRRLATYPPAIPGSRYVRGRGMANKDGVVTRFTSEKLGSRWTTRTTRAADGLTGIVGNTASYAEWVQSKANQAGVHRGRWETDEGALRKETPAIVGDFQGAINTALEK